MGTKKAKGAFGRLLTNCTPSEMKLVGRREALRGNPASSGKTAQRTEPADPTRPSTAASSAVCSEIEPGRHGGLPGHPTSVLEQYQVRQCLAVGRPLHVVVEVLEGA
jgi:hypothetical protein